MDIIIEPQQRECFAMEQADLRLARERLRRKAAIMARQEEEVTAKERALESAAVDTQALQHALDQARSDAAKHKVRPCTPCCSF